MPVTTDRWTLDSSAQWTTPADWSLGRVPGANDDAVVSPTSGSAIFTVTLASSATVDSLAGVTLAGLDIGSIATAGTLVVVNPTNAAGGAAIWSGLLQLDVGLLDLKNGWTIASAADFFTGTTLEVDAGTLALLNGGALLGSVTGGGFVSLAGPSSFDIGAGIGFANGTLSIGAPASLDASASVSHLVLQSGGRLRLAGFTFTAGAAQNLGALVTGAGTLIENGGVTNGLTIQSTVTAEITGSMAVTGAVTVFNTSDLLIASGANYNLMGDFGVIGDTSSTLDIEGTLAKSGGGATSPLVAGTIDLHGTITAGAGTIALGATTMDVSGQFSGSGKVAFETGSIAMEAGASFAAGLAVELAASTVTTLEAAQTINGFFAFDGATTSGGNTDPAATIDMNGQTLSLLGGALLSGFITDPTLSGATEVMIGGLATIAGLTDGDGGGAIVQISGTAVQTGALTMVFDPIADGAPVVQVLAGGTDDLAGDVGIVEGAGGAVRIQGLLEKTAGTAVSTVSGFLVLSGGTIAVATGTVELAGNQADPPVTLNAGTVTGGGLLLLDNAGGATLGSLSGALTVNGTVEMTGSSDDLSGSVTGSGTLVIQNATSVTLGHRGAASLSVAHLDFTNTSQGFSIIDVQGTTASVGGTLDIAAISTIVTVDGKPTSGTANNTLDLTGTGALDGSGGGVVFFTALAGLTIAAGGDYEMTAVNIGGGVSLDDYGNVIADGGIVLDSDGGAATSKLIVESTGTFHLAGSGSAIGETGSTGTIENSGLIEKLSGSGLATITASTIENLSTLLVNSGTLSISCFVNSSAGDMFVGPGAELVISSGYSGNVFFEGARGTLAIGANFDPFEGVGQFAFGDTIDIIGVANASVQLDASANAGIASHLIVNGKTLIVGAAAYGGFNVTTASDGNGGTDIGLAVAVASGSLPEADTELSSQVAAAFDAQVAKLIPAGGTVNVDSVGGGGSGATVAGALNALAVTASGAGSVVALPAGFQVAYLLGGTGNLTDTTGGVVMIVTSAGGALTGAASDTLYGGDAGNTLFATTGAETLIGGTGTNSIFLGASTAFLQSNGTDLITGSSVAETVIATGSVLYFGTSGATNFTASGSGGDTLIGGTAGSTITGGGGPQLIFGSTSLTYTGGSGAATVIGGGTGNSVTGGSGNLLLFASSSLTYSGTGGAATIIGGGGAMNVNLGTGGGIVYGSPNGSDTLSSGSGLAILVGGGTGDVVVATGAANDTLVAGAGAETLSGSGSSGSLVLFGGSGTDVMAGGSGRNLFIAGTGNETLAGGSGPNDIILAANTGTSRIDVITGFNVSTDAIGLFGFGAEPGADATALAAAASDGHGNTVVSLSDGTMIVFTGAPTLGAGNFF